MAEYDSEGEGAGGGAPGDAPRTVDVSAMLVEYMNSNGRGGAGTGRAAPGAAAVAVSVSAVVPASASSAAVAPLRPAAAAAAAAAGPVPPSAAAAAAAAVAARAPVAPPTPPAPRRGKTPARAPVGAASGAAISLLDAARAAEDALLDGGRRAMFAPLDLKRQFAPTGRLRTRTRERQAGPPLSSAAAAAGATAHGTGVVKIERFEIITRQLERYAGSGRGPGVPTCVAAHPKFIAVGMYRGVVVVFDHYQVRAVAAVTAAVSVLSRWRRRVLYLCMCLCVRICGVSVWCLRVVRTCYAHGVYACIRVYVLRGRVLRPPLRRTCGTP